MLVTGDELRGLEANRRGTAEVAAEVAIASGVLAGPTLPADKAAVTLEGSAFTPQMSANFLEVAMTIIYPLHLRGGYSK